MTLAEVWTQRRKRVVAPSFQLSAVAPSGTKEWRARLFNNLPNMDGMPGFPDTKVLDAIMCSAPAPVYFPAHDVPGTPGGNAFVDGGVFANNPSTAALAALIGSQINGEQGIPLSRVYLLSVGTGFMANSYPPPDARFPYGVLGWLRPRQDDGARRARLRRGRCATQGGPSLSGQGAEGHAHLADGVDHHRQAWFLSEGTAPDKTEG